MSSTETYSVIMSLFCCPPKVAQTICAISGCHNALQLSAWLWMALLSLWLSSIQLCDTEGFSQPSKAWCVHPTLQAHNAAHDDNVAGSPLLHVRHDLFYHAHGSEEVGLKHFLHVIHADALHRAQQTHTCIINWKIREERWVVMVLTVPWGTRLVLIYSDHISFK